MDYNEILLAPKGETVDKIGGALCLPVSCSADMIKNGFNYVLDKEKIPLQVLSVVNKIGEYSYPFDLSFYVTVLLLTVLLVLVLVSSCSSQFGNHRYFGVFSIKRSWKNFSYHEGKSLNVLNGVKSLAFMWMLLFGSEYPLTIYFVVNTLTVE